MRLDGMNQRQRLRRDQVRLSGAAHDAQYIRRQLAHGALNAGQCAFAREQSLILVAEFSHNFHKMLQCQIQAGGNRAFRWACAYKITANQGYVTLRGRGRNGSPASGGDGGILVGAAVTLAMKSA
jgi:hypothetical protein